ncbi:MAG: DUF3021 domain-containing protein [Lachnospiraceae bacterium]|nr:DUF3021 domain-containing protein [Lachnospiraceae bacterium]
MNKRISLVSIWEHYLEKEIGIEFKACLYFFCILFFYSIYRLLGGTYEASIIHMAEMIGMTYAMGYIQVYVLSNFDEGERLGGKEIFYMILCALIYTGISFWTGWFDRKTGVSICFFVYIIITYLCAFLVYRSKRRIDERLLNNDLQKFKERQKYEERNRD